MAIIYRKGDVLEALRKGEVDIVIHQTNCQGVMGSGIAKQIKSAQMRKILWGLV